MCLSKDKGGLGFRNLRFFNLVMLIKQGWRLVSNQDYFHFCILKAKFFPRMDFLDATEGSNPNFVLKSILQGKDLLNFGNRWRVGNGQMIKVWGDPRLNKDNGFFVDSPCLEGLEDFRVSSLINENSTG